MPDHAADWVNAIGTWALVLVGLLTATIGIWTFRKQLRQAAYINITQRVFELDMMFVNDPSMRPYFYDQKIAGYEAEDHFQKLTALAEYILDFYSTLQEHKHLLHNGTPSWSEWIKYIQDGFRNSPYLCYYFEQNKDWYENELHDDIYLNVAEEEQTQKNIERQKTILDNKDKVLS